MKQTVEIKNTGLLYFFVCMMVNVWCVQSQSERINLIDIPHIILRFPPIWIAVFLGVFVILISSLYRNIQVDIIVLFLFLRLLIPLIDSFYTGKQQDFWGNFAISVVCIISYIIASNTIKELDKFHWLLCLFFLIIVGQTICESFLGKNSFWGDTYYYKNDLTIPIGSSNSIGSKIIPCYAFLFCTSNSKLEKVLLTAAVFFTVGITKSRSSIIVCLLIFALIVAWNGKFSGKRLILFICVMAALGIGFLYFTQDSQLGGFVFYDNLSTIFRRENLIGAGIEEFWKYPILGEGFSENVIKGNPHNLIVFILMRSGIVGIVLFISIVTLILRDFHGYYTDKIVRGCFCFMLCMFMQSMAEIVLFSYACDFMFWFIVGIGSARIRQINMNYSEDKKVVFLENEY